MNNQDQNSKKKKIKKKKGWGAKKRKKPTREPEHQRGRKLDFPLSGRGTLPNLDGQGTNTKHQPPQDGPPRLQVHP